MTASVTDKAARHERTRENRKVGPGRLRRRVYFAQSKCHGFLQRQRAARLPGGGEGSFAKGGAGGGEGNVYLVAVRGRERNADGLAHSVGGPEQASGVRVPFFIRGKRGMGFKRVRQVRPVADLVHERERLGELAGGPPQCPPAGG